MSLIPDSSWPCTLVTPIPPSTADGMSLTPDSSWPRTLRFLCLVFFSFAPFLSSVQAQVRTQRWKQRWKELRRLRFQLSIKAPTHLMFRVERDKGGRPMLQGHLRDDQARGVGGQSLRLRLPNRKQQWVQTDKQGLFRLATIGWPRQGLYQMRFDGNRRYAASHQRRILDMRRVDLQISTRFPSPLPAGTHEFHIDVHLKYQGHSQKGMPVTLLIQAKQGQSSGMVGKLPTSIRREISEKATMALMTLYTNEQGRARFVWQGKALQGPAEIPLAISFPGSTYFLPQRVRSLLVVTPTRSAESYKDIGVMIGWIVLFLGTMALLWWSFKQEWWRRDEVPALLPSFDDQVGEIETGRVERVASHEGFSVTINDHTIAGVLLGLGEKKPLHGVTVTVQPLEEDGKVTRWRWQTISNAKGHFLVDCPKTGLMQVSFSHPHYQIKQMEIALPHQSRHRVLRVSLVSYQHLIYETFLMAARRMVLGQTFDPRTQTVREFLHTLRAGHVEQFAPLAKAFEKAYYGSIIPTVEDYESLRDLFQTQK